MSETMFVDFGPGFNSQGPILLPTKASFNHLQEEMCLGYDLDSVIEKFRK